MKSEDFYTTFLRYPQICTDSRKVQPGCLYFALKGEHFNGNIFAADALDKGSAFAVVDDPEVAKDGQYILVPDVLGFLQDLASLHRSHLRIPVIGLTGTNGKTTTKELIHSVLKQKYRTVATFGNLNNHIGVPLTILAAGPDTEMLIVEMGANHPGEIAFLCNIARPTAGLITNIGKAHLEGFGSFEGVIRTKNELYQSLINSGGQLFLNLDDERLRSLAGDYPYCSYGTSENADICGWDAGEGRFLEVKWKTEGGGSNRVESQLTGSYNLYNVLAAIAIGNRFGLSDQQINAGIESYVPGNMRSQWLKTDKNLLLLDAYNANPSSMALALEHFASLSLPNSIALLGDMFELGDQSREEHLHIVRLAESLGFAKIFFAGPVFFELASGFFHHFFESTDSLRNYLSDNPVEGCNVLVKGSRGMQLEKLIDLL